MTAGPTQPFSGEAGTSSRERTRSAASITESEDAIRNLKASESVQAAFLATGIASPPGDVAAIITNHVKSAIQGLPLSQVANMSPGSGVLATSAAAAVDQFVSSLSPSQREAVKAGVNPLDATGTMKLNAMLNPDAGNFARLMAGRDARDGSGRGTGYGDISTVGLSGLTPAEKATHSYAIAQGVMWAAENREILKLGNGAIDIIKQTQLRKDVYDGLTTDAHLSGKGALGIAKALHEKGQDANQGGREVTKNLKEVGDSEYTAAVDRFGLTHFKKDATEQDKEAARESVRHAGEEVAKRKPEKAETIKRNNELIGAAKKTDELATKAAVTTNAKAVTAKSSSQLKRDAF